MLVLKTPCSIEGDNLLLFVRLTPKAAKVGITGVMESDDNRVWLKVAVTAVPEDGKANAALIVYLAKIFKVSKSSIELVSGQTSRYKTLRLYEGKGKADLLSSLLYK